MGIVCAGSSGAGPGRPGPRRDACRRRGGRRSRGRRCRLRSPSSSIVVEGNRRVEAETIRSYFQPGPGGRLDAAKIDEALKALYATGLFQDVRISQAGGRLIVTVVENPVINRVAFEGNKKAKDEQLQSEVQSKPRGTLSRPTVQADVQRIIEIYHRNGRFDVRVDAEDHRAAEQPRRSGLRDQRRRQDRRQEDRFVGNKAYSRLPAEGRDQDLRDQSGSASCRRPTSTIPTASRPTATCCAASTSSTAMPTCASSRRSASTIRRRRASSSPSRSTKARSTRSAPSTSCRTSARSIRHRCAARLKLSAGQRLQRRSGREDRSKT